MTSPYRDPGQERAPRLYFVKSSDDASEKGPFTLKTLRTSVARNALRDTALVREVGQTEWCTVFAALRGIKKRSPGAASDIIVLKSQDLAREERDAATNWRLHVCLGSLLLTAGCLLSTISFGHYTILFYGVIVTGLVSIGRGVQALRRQRGS